MADLISIKVTTESLKRIAKIAAETGEKKYEVVDRLAQKEAESLGLIPAKTKQLKTKK